MKKNKGISKSEICMEGEGKNIQGGVSKGRNDSSLGRVSEAGKTFGS